MSIGPIKSISTVPAQPVAKNEPAASAGAPKPTPVDAFEEASKKLPVSLTVPTADDWADGGEFDTDGTGGGGMAGIDPS